MVESRRRRRASQQEQMEQRPQKGEKDKRKKEFSRFFLFVYGLALLAVLTSALMYSAASGRFNDLKAQRATEAARVQAHKDEHINARKNSGFQDMINQAAREYDISPSFLSAIIKCESSFDRYAVSRVNARGLMQIMPNTGTDLAKALRIADYTPDSLFDPQLNIRFGAHYLSYLSSQFAGSPVMTAAAYHAGANNVKQWALRDSQDKKTVTLDAIPMDNTRDYVRKVMDAYAIYYEEDEVASRGAVPLDSVLASGFSQGPDGK